MVHRGGALRRVRGGEGRVARGARRQLRQPHEAAAVQAQPLLGARAAHRIPHLARRKRFLASPPAVAAAPSPGCLRAGSSTRASWRLRLQGFGRPCAVLWELARWERPHEQPTHRRCVASARTRASRPTRHLAGPCWGVPATIHWIAHWNSRVLRLPGAQGTQEASCGPRADTPPTHPTCAAHRTCPAPHWLIALCVLTQQTYPAHTSAQAALPGTVTGLLLHGLPGMACLATQRKIGCSKPWAALAGGCTGAGHLVAGGGRIKGAHSALRPFTILPADRQPPPHDLLACRAAGAPRSAVVSLLAQLSETGRMGRRRAGDRPCYASAKCCSPATSSVGGPACLACGDGAHGLPPPSPLPSQGDSCWGMVPACR
jgi:hypothetical protein